MALIECTECENDVSDKAETCPHCGISLASLIAAEQEEETPVAAEQTTQPGQEAAEKAKKEEEERKLQAFLAARMKARYGEDVPWKPLFNKLLRMRDTTEWAVSKGTADPSNVAGSPATYGEWLTAKDALGESGLVTAAIAGVILLFLIVVLMFFWRVVLLALIAGASFFAFAHVVDSVAGATTGALMVVVVSAGIMFSGSSASSSSSSPGCSFPKSSGFTELEKCYDEKLVTERHDLRGCRMSENQSECSIRRCGTYDETAWRRANNPDYYGVSR